MDRGDNNPLANRYRVDHSAALLTRLLDLVNTDTCDVTFVVGPAGNSRLGFNSSSSSDDCCASGLPPGAAAGEVKSTTEASAGEDPANTSVVLSKSVNAAVLEPMGDRNRHSSFTTATTTVDNSSSSRSRRTASTLLSCRSPRTTTVVSATTGGIATSRGGRLESSDGVASSSSLKEKDRLDGRGGGAYAKKATNSAPGPAAQAPAQALARERIDRETTEATLLAPSSTAPPSDDNGGGVREFRCHRVLFASCSEYFRVLLYGGMSESLTRRVELRDVAPEGFEAIVTYVYTGRVLITAGENRNINIMFFIAKCKYNSSAVAFQSGSGVRE